MEMEVILVVSYSLPLGEEVSPFVLSVRFIDELGETI